MLIRVPGGGEEGLVVREAEREKLGLLFLSEHWFGHGGRRRLRVVGAGGHRCVGSGGNARYAMSRAGKGLLLRTSTRLRGALVWAAHRRVWSRGSDRGPGSCSPRWWR